MELSSLIFDSIVRSLATGIIFYLIWRRLSWIKRRIEIIEDLARGSFLHSSNCDREVYWLRRRICLEHYYPPDKLGVDNN